MSGPRATLHPDNSITYEWPEGKPDSFEIATVVFEALVEKIEAERALADDLADVLDRFEPEWGRPIEVKRILAHYREARGR
jgi:hypothetical protein